MTPEASPTRWVEEPERQYVDVPAIMAANPSIGLTADAAMIAASIVAESVPVSRPTTAPDEPEPTTAAKIADTAAAAGIHIDPWQRRLLDALYPEPDNDTPPIVTALAAVSRLAVELADLRPQLSARDRRAVDATLVALGTPEPSLLKSLFGAP